ncbi:uncharacterized protein M421DRAFT_109615 [Didymella exigua CBS 183.55]|uniref:Uncharacterized protein n=1 Tax=Didymella exigua CBS 183.55 TaxID=1150837 RepID=A0A6A5S2J8_9PLEO|nr:uncharacterized protein M421DRAFT_109615 [Didymella exigua CBS 183.55]KAF1933969.1 hypothetical protein M421DRAFT_109615 [Didymella exigua CBS 183.55]
MVDPKVECFDSCFNEVLQAFLRYQTITMKMSHDEVPIQVQPSAHFTPPQKPHLWKLPTPGWIPLKLLPSHPNKSLPPSAATVKDCRRSDQSRREDHIHQQQQTLRSSCGRPARRASPPAPHDDVYQTIMPSSVGRTLKPPSVPRLSEPWDTQPGYRVRVIVCESECERFSLSSLTVCSAVAFEVMA